VPVPADVLGEPAYWHGVMAQLLDDPHRLAASGDSGGRGWPGLDVRRLRQMAGLVAKVRHNPVRVRLPLTMRALATAGIEIDFFADLAPELSDRRRAGLSDEERTTIFVDALRRWLRPADRAHRLVADVLAHELTLRELAEHEPVRPPALDAVVDTGSRPRLRAGVRVLHLTVHPPDVAGGTQVGATPPAVDRAPRCYLYVPTPAGVRVKDLAPALAPLLQMADGSATVAEMAAALHAEATTARDLAAVFQLLVRRGLADIEDR
jgi:hypothetical protein